MQHEGPAFVSRFTMEIVTAAVTLVFGLIVIAGGIEYEHGWDASGPKPGYFPFYIGILIVIGSVGVLAQAFLGRARMSEAFVTAVRARRVAAFVLPVIGFVVLANVMGLYVAMAVYLCAVMVLQGDYRLSVALLTAITTTVFFFFVFERWFKVQLLKGPIEAWFGIY
jgi:Tripartite tricarboxylate transporter TctB family